MGRRKIEIKAIKDDRNRSVTFLKRKGGLFKKAHELSVLCSVDVAVIIFGNNKKVYEYSSSDIGDILSRYQYYGGASEHKGPADFHGKGGKDDDDDDDEDLSPPSHHEAMEQQMMAPQFQNQAAFQHMRNHTPSASPPMPNGVFPHHAQVRVHTPQPPQGGSRPASRNAPARAGAGLMPQHSAQPNGYAFMPNPAIYNPQNGNPLPPHHGHPQAHPGMPPHMQAPQMQGPPQGVPQGPPQYPPYGSPQPPQHQPVQQIYMNEQQRRSSIPPAFTQERPPSRPHPSPPQPTVQQQQLPPQPQPKLEPQQQPQQPPSQQQQPQQMLEPVKRMSVNKSRSIFTPIDESRSILSQHWASSTSNADPAPAETASANRKQPMDVGAASRNPIPKPSPPPPIHAQTHKARQISMSSHEGFTPPSRTNSGLAGGGKRPQLTVQIPEEPSDGGSPSAGTNSPRSANNAAADPSRRNGKESHSSMVLPPPSPSASALMSAGASGPVNPFARPHPVSQPSNSNGSSSNNNSNNNNNNMIDTPVSALPSRFMTNEFLPSPSSFYPDWNYRGDGNSLISPLNFATPVVGTGPSFLRDDPGLGPGKRKTSDDGEEGTEGELDAKRIKHEV